MGAPADDPSGGWNASAEAWIRFVDEGDVNRTHLLDPVMLDLCGEVKGKKILDVGCGEGRFCRILQQRGADVTGLDSTERLIEEARRRHPAGHYVVGDAAQLHFPAASFALCVSYIALIDIADHHRAIAEMARVLRPGGQVVIANHQPYFTSTLSGWVTDASGRKLHLPVDNYLSEHQHIGNWRGIQVNQYHRPMQSIMGAFLKSGLQLVRFLEPAASAEAMKKHPVLAEDRRAPIFFAMEWRKPESA